MNWSRSSFFTRSTWGCCCCCAPSSSASSFSGLTLLFNFGFWLDFSALAWDEAGTPGDECRLEPLPPVGCKTEFTACVESTNSDWVGAVVVVDDSICVSQERDSFKEDLFIFHLMGCGCTAASKDGIIQIFICRSGGI
jgi:hypothetical protein